MGQSNFLESLVEIMLSWMRWLTGWFWSIINSEGGGGGFLNWFADHWVGTAIFLIVLGVVVDWLIWMIRWRPYWLWIRKRQYVYEEVDVKRKSRRKVRKPVETEMPEEEFDDPFLSKEGNDPYAQAGKQQENEFSEWDSENDPYARQNEVHTDYDPRIYARPTLGEAPRENKPRRRKPVFGERMNQNHVDDGHTY